VLPVLVILNVLLQLFDGIATYVGWEQHGEQNPLLRMGFEIWGDEATLVTAKLTAILLVFLIARLPRPTLATAGLFFTSTAYMALSLVPWTYRLLLA
jgi:hypothetical protein